tara:strand:- start:3653 stop:3853 length:201 start_codon:yes stop_codon:yes gene_type:complete
MTYYVDHVAHRVKCVPTSNIEKRDLTNLFSEFASHLPFRSIYLQESVLRALIIILVNHIAWEKGVL